MSAKWGAAFECRGFLLRAVAGKCRHSFGGDSWKIASPEPSLDRPAVIVELDFGDPLLRQCLPSLNFAKRMPLASFVNSSAWYERQDYEFDPELLSISWISKSQAPATCYEPEDCLPTPLPFSYAELVGMTEGDVPLDEEQYWAIGDAFLGGEDFIRIGGSPYWLQEPVELQCNCEREMRYVAAIGHESLVEAGQFGDAPFFIGEAALYFYVCCTCRMVSVISQST